MLHMEATKVLDVKGPKDLRYGSRYMGTKVLDIEVKGQMQRSNVVVRSKVTSKAMQSETLASTPGPLTFVFLWRAWFAESR